MQPLQVCIGPIIRIGRESWCLPYAGFLKTNMKISLYPDFQKLQDQLYFDRNGDALRLIPICLICEPAL